MTSGHDLRRPHVSVVVPSWRGEVTTLRDSLTVQSYQDYELVVVTGVSPAGQARNEGVARARGEILVFIDDDAALGHPQVLGQLVAALEHDGEIGVVGSSKLLSPAANHFQRRVAHEVPRWVFPVLDENLTSNPPLDQYGFSAITTTCCAMRRSVFEEVGGFDPALTTGEDPDFFVRVRRAGYHFVVLAHCWVYHDPPASLGELVRKSFRYGVGHAQEARKSPERNMELVPLSRWHGRLLLLLSPLLVLPLLFVNLYFDPVRHWRIGFRPLKAASTLATLYGYSAGWFGQKRMDPAPDEGVKSQTIAAELASASQSSTFSGLAFLLIALINNLFAIVMARLLSVSDYGLLGMAQSLLLIASTLLNSGFSWVLARELAMGLPLAQVERTARSALLGTMAVAGACCALLVGLVWLGMLDLGQKGPLLLLLLVGEILLLGLAAVLAGVLQGSLRFGVLSIGRTLEVLVKILAGVGLVVAGWGVVGALAAMVLGTALALLPLAWGARGSRLWRAPGGGNPRTYRHALVLLAGLSALAVIGHIDIIALKLFSPSGQASTLTGHYQGAIVLARIPALLAGAYAAALFPYFSRSDPQTLRIYSIGGLKYTLLLITPISLILAANPAAAIDLIFPPAYAAAAPALRVAALSSVALSLATVLCALLQARGGARAAAIWLALAALVELATIWLLVPVFGVVGAALGLAAGAGVACLSLLIVARRMVVWPSIGAALGYLAACAALVALQALLPQQSLLALSATTAAALTAYGALLAISGVLRPADLATLTAGVDIGRLPAAPALYRWLSRAVDRLNRLGLSQTGRGRSGSPGRSV